MARKPHTYAAVCKHLKKLPLDPERADYIEAVKLKIVTATNGAGGTDNEMEVLTQTITDCLKRVYEIELHAINGKLYAGEFGRVYAEIRKLKDRLDEWESDMNLLLEAYKSLMIDQFDVEGISSLRLDNGQPISTWPEPHAQVVDREKYRQWCVKNGLETSLMLAWQTTNAMVKKFLLQGLPEPPGVDVYTETKIRLGSE